MPVNEAICPTPCPTQPAKANQSIGVSVDVWSVPREAAAIRPTEATMAPMVKTPARGEPLRSPWRKKINVNEYVSEELSARISARPIEENKLDIGGIYTDLPGISEDTTEYKRALPIELV